MPPTYSDRITFAGQTWQCRITPRQILLKNEDPEWKRTYPELRYMLNASVIRAQFSRWPKVAPRTIPRTATATGDTGDRLVYWFKVLRACELQQAAGDLARAANRRRGSRVDQAVDEALGAMRGTFDSTIASAREKLVFVDSTAPGNYLLAGEAIEAKEILSEHKDLGVWAGNYVFRELQEIHDQYYAKLP